MVVIQYHLEHEYGRTRAGYESSMGGLLCLRSQDEHSLWVSREEKHRQRGRRTRFLDTEMVV